MSHRFRIVLVLALAALWSHSAIAQRAGYRTFTDPSNRFAVEFPTNWDWTIVSGSGEALVVFVEPKKKEAAVVVERFRLKQKLARNDITDLFASIEKDVLKENQPKATDLDGKVLDQNGRRAVVIDYLRPVAVNGRAGAQERVRQYSFPVSDSLYRVTCASLASEFKKYESIFSVIAESLKSAGELDAKPVAKPKP